MHGGAYSECYGILCTAILTPHYIGFAHLAFHRSFRLRLSSVGVVRGVPCEKGGIFIEKLDCNINGPGHYLLAYLESRICNVHVAFVFTFIFLTPLKVCFVG